MKRARDDVSRSLIAARVVHAKGKVGVSDATLGRLERATGWPQNPDAVVRAYGEVLGVEPLKLWSRAIADWKAASR